MVLTLLAGLLAFVTLAALISTAISSISQPSSAYSLVPIPVRVRRRP